MQERFYRRLTYKSMGFFLLWLLLSDSYNLGHMSLGFVASFGVAVLNTHRDTPPGPSARWAGAIYYVPWLFSRILLSGVHLCYLILHPRLPIAPRMLRYRPKLDQQTAVVLLGNSITLTPGTVTVEVSDEELLVHALDEESTQDLSSGRLEERVSRVFKSREGRS